MIIDKEIKNLIQPLTQDERQLLEESILTEGCRDALIVWNDILLDGHNRYEICQAYNIPFQTVNHDFDSREAAINWIINNQLGRRNLTPEAVSYLRGKRYQAEKRQGERTDLTSGKSYQKSQDLADEFKVSERTIRNDATFAAAVDTLTETLGDDVRADILGREARLTKTDTQHLAEIAVSNPETAKTIVERIRSGESGKDTIKLLKREQREEQRRQTVEQKIDTLPPQTLDRFKLIVGDMRERMPEIYDASIDVIITDPPYSEEYLSLYEDLAKEAARVLKPGASLIVMIGQSYVPEILALMTPHINYQWMCCYEAHGASTQLWQRKVLTQWKPLLWFVNGEYSGEWKYDILKSDRRDKEHHDWGQSESGMLDIVERFSVQGDIILDPFCGAGTTGLVAIATNRKFIGIDIEPLEIERTRQRILEIC